MAAQKIVRPIFDNPFLNIVELPGHDSVKRGPEPLNPPNSDPESASVVLSKDVNLDSDKQTWMRIYIPRHGTIDSSSSDESPKKLPVIVYYHGGGFVFLHANSTVFDVFCQGLVQSVGAIVISLEYRLAPEHRLPAAYEDAMDGLRWIKSTQDEWVRDYADLSNCYLCGTSAGGNLAYHAGLRVAATAAELRPLTMRGVILHHPYFSGTKRTESEEKLKNDPLLPLYAIDQMFDLSLPKGSDHDHEYCNPSVNGGSEHLDDMKDLGWKVLVTGCFDDPLVDACFGVANLLEEKGIKTFKFFSDGYHAMEVFDPSMASPLFDVTKDFISDCSN